MKRYQQSLTYSLLLFLVPACILGVLLGETGWTLFVGLLGWLIVQYRRFRTLISWVAQATPGDEPPEADGHWGELLDGLSRLSRAQSAKEQQYRRVINRFQQTSAALPDGVVIVDKGGLLEWWNRSAEQLLGLRRLSDRGKPLINLMRDPRFIRFYKAGRFEDSLQLPGPTNPDQVLQFSITLFGDDDRLLVVRDITHMIRLEQTRQDFVANASHELRTPLTVVKGYLETFSDNDTLPTPLHRAFKQMQQQTERMENLVTDLLLLSRLETVKVSKSDHPIPIEELMRPIIDAANKLTEDKGQQLTTEFDNRYHLLGQEAELHSAFSNLVYNAIRYTPEGGSIDVQWQVNDLGQGIFAVRDTGIGIEAAHLPRLTERFYRVDKGRSSSSGGTGLGLAIVKHVLMRHEAQLEITSELGKGSCFKAVFSANSLLLNVKRRRHSSVNSSTQ